MVVQFHPQPKNKQDWRSTFNHYLGPFNGELPCNCSPSGIGIVGTCFLQDQHSGSLNHGPWASLVVVHDDDQELHAYYHQVKGQMFLTFLRQK